MQNRKTHILLITFLAMLSNVVDFGITTSTLMYYIKLREGTVTTFAIVMSVSLLAHLFGIVLWGKASDRFGRRKILLICMTGSALSMLMLAFADSVTTIYISRIIAGSFYASFSILCTAAAEMSAPENRVKNLSILEAGITAGNFVLGPLLGGLCYRIFPEFAYLVGFGIGAFNLILCYFFFGERQKPLSVVATVSQTEKSASTLLGLLKYKTSFGALLIMFFLGLSLAPYDACFILYLKAILGLDSMEAGRVTAVFGMSCIFIQSFLSARIVKRYGGPVVLITGLFVGTLVAAVASVIGSSYVAPNLYLIFALETLQAFAFSFVLASAVSIYLAEISKYSNAGFAIGVFRAAIQIARLSAPLSAILFQQVSVRAPFFLSEISWFCALIIFGLWQWSSDSKVETTPSEVENFDSEVTEVFAKVD